MRFELFAIDAALVLGLMTVLWLVSVRLRDVSIVDPWWSIAFLLPTFANVIATGMTPGKLAVLAVVVPWSIRLWAYLLGRQRGKAEDPRYAAFRARFGPARYWWFSLFQVFLLQGALALVISLPLQVAAAAPRPDPIEWNDVVALALGAAGFFFEAIGDAQLSTFKADPESRGKVCDRGLWRYTRHPNYFGEALLALAFYAFAVDAPYGWATAFAPALMIWLLLRVSGVSMLDAHMLATKPGYAAYVAKTSAFVPRPPRDQ